MVFNSVSRLHLDVYSFTSLTSHEYLLNLTPLSSHPGITALYGLLTVIRITGDLGYYTGCLQLFKLFELIINSITALRIYSISISDGAKKYLELSKAVHKSPQTRNGLLPYHMYIMMKDTMGEIAIKISPIMVIGFLISPPTSARTEPSNAKVAVINTLLRTIYIVLAPSLIVRLLKGYSSNHLNRFNHRLTFHHLLKGIPTLQIFRSFL